MSEVSIRISARDNYSSAINTMRNSTRSFTNDAEKLQNKLDSLSRAKTTIKVDMQEAARNLRELKKEYTELKKSSSTSADALENASGRVKEASNGYERIKRNLNLVNNEMKNTQKNLKNIEKEQNRVSNIAVVKDFAARYATEQFSHVAQQGIKYYMTSSLGDKGGNIVGNMLSSAVAGASAGFLTAGPMGAAIGAGIGTVSGAFQGYIENKSARDDIYKDFVQSSYETQQEKISDSMTNGTSLASQREVDKISFTTLFGGSAKTADSFLSGIVDFANSTPFLYDDLTSISKTLLTYGYKSNEIMEVLQNVGDAGAALGMDTAGMASVATGLGRMRSSGKTSLEYVNLMQERGIDAIGALAQAHGITNAEVYEGISQNLFDGAESAKIISDYMSGKYNGSMKEISETYQGLSSTLQGLQDELDNAMGEGYTDTRKEGIENAINELGGNTGELIKGMYNQYGAFQGELENLQTELEMNAMKAVGGFADESELDKFSESAREKLQALAEEYNQYRATIDQYENYGGTGENAEESRKEYEQAQSESAKIIAEARVIANNEYLESEGYELMQEANLSLIDRIQDSSTTAYENAGMKLSEAFSIGLQKGLNSQRFTVEDPNGNDRSISFTTYRDKKGKEISPSAEYGNGYAYGLPYVPYNGYPATLHEGERVLTAAENRNYGKSSGRVVISGNNFTVREDADIDKIASALLAKIEQADLSYYG